MDSGLVLTLVLWIAGVVLAGDDRLPDVIEPITYDVTVTTTVGGPSTFVGEVIITFTTKATISRIDLHAVDMTEILAVFTTGTGIIDTLLVSDRLILTLTPPNEMLNGATYAIKITYEGKFNFVPKGLYISETDWITQLGTTEARRVFPCMDQPDKKAKFKITVNYPTLLDYNVYSNALITTGTPAGQSVFSETMKMSTHVIAWATLKDYKAIPITGTRVPLTVLRDPSMSLSSFDVLKKMLPAAVNQLEVYLNYQLPSTKLDALVISNTKFGGMENCGLPTFSSYNVSKRYEAIAFEDSESASDDRQRISQLVTHEVAQQWFGGLVTPKWWDEVWLSEGFATYFEYFTIDEVEKDWQMDQQFVVQQTQAALQVDWYSGAYTDAHAGKHRDSHPLIIPKVETTDDIDKIFNFDAITLSKSASVVRMLNAILGEANFKNAVKNYLSGRQYSNVDTAYLWEIMGASLPAGALPSGLTLAKAMEKWTTQVGFPEIVATRDYNAENVKLTQTQFLLPPHKAVGSPYTWNVPIFWITEKDPTAQPALHWLQPDVPDTNEIKLPSVTDEQWLLINKNHAGFYRVNYDQKNWQLLSESFLNLTSTSRAMLLDDALNLARGGRLDYDTAFGVTELLPNETNFAPWSAALNGFSFLYDRLSNDSESREVIKKYILEKLTYIYDYIGGFDIATGEPHIRLLMKQLILHWACRVGHVTCIRKADDLFNSWISSTTNLINPDLRRVMYCTGIQQGGSADFIRLKTRYMMSSTAIQDKPRIVYALGCVNDSETLREYLTDSLKTSGINGRQVFTAV
ncbi:hypothetical protein B566_EDAN002872 [Ephemera danica]|nr:hypothetical protein B566_EDAN002872 [Ephemera danica]